MAAIWFRRVRRSDAQALAAIRLSARASAVPHIPHRLDLAQETEWLGKWFIGPALGAPVLEDPRPATAFPPDFGEAADDLWDEPGAEDDDGFLPAERVPGQVVSSDAGSPGWPGESDQQAQPDGLRRWQAIEGCLTVWDGERWVPTPAKTYDPEGNIRSLPHVEVAMAGRDPVGFVVAHAGADWYDALPDWARTCTDPCYLRHLYVAPAFQRRGIGARLLRRTLRLAPHKGMLLHVFRENTRAIRFYEGQGFRSVPGRGGKTPEGDELTLMQRPRGEGRLARRFRWAPCPLAPEANA